MNALAITIAELREHCACDLDDRIAAITAHLGRPVADDEHVPLAAWAEVTPNAQDLMWALRCCWDRGGRAVGVEVACRAADRALVHARPQDVPVLRAAIDAARGHVAGIVTLAELNAAWAAARAAAGAARAAAWAASDAASAAASDAASAAASAAAWDAARAAAWAASDAASAAASDAASDAARAARAASAAAWDAARAAAWAAASATAWAAAWADVRADILALVSA